MDILLEANWKFYQQPVIKWLRDVPSRHAKAIVSGSYRQLTRVGTGLSTIGSKLSVVIIPHAKSSDAISHEDTDKCDSSAAHNNREPRYYGDLRHDPASPYPMSPVTERGASPALLSPTSLNPSSMSVASLTSQTDTNASTESASAATASLTLGGAGRRRFASAIRTVITANRATNTPAGLGVPRKPRTKVVGPDEEMVPEGERGRSRSGNSTPRVSRVATLVPALKSLQPTELFQPHTALVRHLQFSPNGEFLATCRCVTQLTALQPPAK